MDAQTARRPNSLTTCAQCGGRLSEPVNFCPQCGAPARLAFSERTSTKKPNAATASKTASATGARANVAPGGQISRSRLTSFVRPAVAAPHGGARSPSRSPGGFRGWRMKTGTALTLVALVVLCGAVVLVHRLSGSADGEPIAASNTAQGSVTANGTSQARRTPAVDAPAITRGSAQNPALAQNSKETTPAPVASVAVPEPAQPSTATPQPSQSVSSQSSVSNNGRDSDKNHRLMALALARAHSGLDKNDLRMARSGIFWALSLQHDNSEALMLKQELLSRERERNTSSTATRGSVNGASPAD
ncbi:hypothetical protein PMI06_005949 [Burkholderia sp. BT03]|nr:hypothetical protein PMI06_005949 [Burkholderia sp. BT03]SKC83861.1 hypothetical protein SAMN06266956_4243 [Paraburkholderia hospita]